MKKGIIILIFLLMILSISSSSGITVRNDESIYVLLNYDGKVRRVDLVNWIEIRGRGRFSIVKEGRYLKNAKLYNEDTQISINSQSIRISGDSKGQKNLYLTASLNKKLPLDFKISYKYNGKISKPEEFIGKKGDLEIEVKIKTLEDLPFRLVMSCEFSADDFLLKNPEDFMVMVLGKTVRLTGFTYPIPEGKIKLLLRGEKLRIPAFTFTALPSLPPLDLSMKNQGKAFLDALEGFLLLNQAHQKILKGILDNLNSQNINIPQEFLTLPFTLVKYQNKAYIISKELESYPQNFLKLYNFIKEKAKEKEEEDWKKALDIAEEVRFEIEKNNFAKEVKEIGDFISDLSFESQKALNLINTSLQGIQKIEELMNTMLYGGEIERKKLPGLIDMEKNIKQSIEKLQDNINSLEKVEKKIKNWENKLKNYNFAGKIPGAISNVRFYFRIEEKR
ncbi:MAG: hypothetical protein NZ841_07675 [Dictyoglomus sp.]|nr:hypothetical protein [Dictyoglomus sp.]MDW8189158.1 hypothetical protein [Dictyoglomus sp.]